MADELTADDRCGLEIVRGGGRPDMGGAGGAGREGRAGAERGSDAHLLHLGGDAAVEDP